MKAYQCQRTGCLFPVEYYEEWGRDGYGVGLGPVPVSEALCSDYHSPPVHPVGQPEKVMHPLGCCHAPLVLVNVTEQEWEEKKAILHRDDPQMAKRAALMQEKQLKKSRAVASIYSASSLQPSEGGYITPA